MKKLILNLGLVIASQIINAQVVSDFENLNLENNSFWNGSTSYGKNIFNSGNGQFHNEISQESWGDYWKSGWAYSNVLDTVTAGFLNQYAVRAGKGAENSNNYAIAQNNSKIFLIGESKGKNVEGFYVCNTTYAALSMENGDQFGKKFGGENGNDPDWFKLSIKKYLDGELSNNEVEFYLADFRFVENEQDYIIKNWTWVDLTTLGEVDSLVFTLSSSDVASWGGMNTPAYFAIDNLKTFGTPLSNQIFTDFKFNIFPNPFSNILNLTNLEGEFEVLVSNNVGQIIYQSIHLNNVEINTSNWFSGIYYISVIHEKQTQTKKIIKQ